MDKKVALVRLIEKCDLLTNEAKIRLIDKINYLKSEEIQELGRLLAAEIRYGRSHKNQLIKEALLLLKQLEEESLNR